MQFPIGGYLSEKPQPQSQYNVESNAFNVEAYFHQFLKERSLVEIVEKNNQLFTESKNLDNEL